MPEPLLREAVTNRKPSEKTIAQLLGRLRISLDALAYRLPQPRPGQCSRTRPHPSDASARIALRPGRTADLQARNERRAPGLLLRRAVSAFVAGDLGVRPLAALLSVDPEDLLAELSPPSRGRLPRADDASYAL